MTTNWEISKQTKAPLAKAVDYFLHPENLPKAHPDFVKEVKIMDNQGDTITLEQHGHIMGRNLRSVNKLVLNRAESVFNIDTLEGDGKGSKVQITLKANAGGTEVKYNAWMELGPLGFFAKGPAKSVFEKTAAEDAAALDSLQA